MSGIFYPMGLDSEGEPRTSWPVPSEEREMVLSLPKEGTMRFTIETVSGDEVDTRATLAEATSAAVSRLEDDPELGTLEVFERVRSPQGIEHVKTITHGPDANWDTIVVVLDPGEKIKPPGYVPRRITEEDLEAYELGDPKRISLEFEIGAWV